MAHRPGVGSPDVFEVCVPVSSLWTSPDAPRDVDAPAVADRPDIAAWATSLDAAARKELHGRTLTQLLMGEGVRVVDERGDWLQVVALSQPSSQHGDGYPGWLPRSHLARPVASGDGTCAFVTNPVTRLTYDGGATTNVSFGTCFWVDGVAGDTVRVLLPGDRRGSVPLQSVRRSDKSEPPAFGPDEILGCARRFLGLRYLWGGTSAWGLDCSGLVHLTYRAHGVVVPRDARDQATFAAPLPLTQVRPGDLYFFARPGEDIYHVGFVTSAVAEDGDRTMLHAPETGELVEDGPLGPDRAATLVSAGRIGGTRVR